MHGKSGSTDEIVSDGDIVLALLEKTSRDSQTFSLAGLDNLASNTVGLVAFLNAHAVNTAVRDPSFAKVLLSADLLLRDGIGVALGLRQLGLPETPNLNGTDLVPQILATNSDRPLVVFGTQRETLDATEARLKRERLGHITLMEDGFQSPDQYAALLKDVPSAVVVLCMGMPKQENVAQGLKDILRDGLIICAGGWADFYSGHKARAPEWIRLLRAEWLHRLLSEPRRLGRRYTIDLAVFYKNIRAASRSQSRPRSPSDTTQK